MFKKHDTYNRENSGVINIIPYTHASISVSVLIQMFMWANVKCTKDSHNPPAERCCALKLLCIYAH